MNTSSGHWGRKKICPSHMMRESPRTWGNWCVPESSIQKVDEVSQVRLGYAQRNTPPLLNDDQNKEHVRVLWNHTQKKIGGVSTAKIKFLWSTMTRSVSSVGLCRVKCKKVCVCSALRQDTCAYLYHKGHIDKVMAVCIYFDGSTENGGMGV